MGVCVHEVQPQRKLFRGHHPCLVDRDGGEFHLGRMAQTEFGRQVQLSKLSLHKLVVLLRFFGTNIVHRLVLIECCKGIVWLVVWLQEWFDVWK